MAELTITIGEESRTYSADHVAVLESNMASIAEWVFNALDEKHRRVLDRKVLELSDKNPAKLAEIEKHEIVRGKLTAVAEKIAEQ